MLKKKSQAALEYLITYAWAFLVILVIIGAIQYLGLLNFQKFLPQKCKFTSQFPCTDFSVSGGEIKLKLANEIGKEVNIDSIAVSNEASPPLDCSAVHINTGTGEKILTPPVIWEAEKDVDIRFAGCSKGGYNKGDRLEAIITLYYYLESAGTPRIYEIRGKINAVVS